MFFGCTITNSVANELDPKKPLDSKDYKVIGYGNSVSSTSNGTGSLIFGEGSYNRNITINGTDNYTITTYLFNSTSKAETKLAELNSGYTLVDSNYGVAYVNGVNGVSQYKTTVVEFTTPSAEKTSILAVQFTNKLKKGIEFED
jgi:hypothetical protein